MRLADIYHARLEGLLRKPFPVWERLGLHVTPNHFYQPIPDTRAPGEETGSYDARHNWPGSFWMRKTK